MSPAAVRPAVFPHLVVWSWDRFAATAITVGLLLDWVPAYLGLDPRLFSLAKLVAVPVLLIDILRYPGDYLFEPSSRFGRLFLTAYLVGVGGGVLAGTVPLGRFVALAPLPAILMFYLKARSSEETGRILKIALWCAAIVPLTALLGATGLIQASISVDTGTGHRVLTGVSWSTLGLYGVFIPAALGGLVFTDPDRPIRRLQLAVAAAMLAIGIGGVLVTGQRTAVAGFGIALVVSLVLYLRRSFSRGVMVMAAVSLLLLALGWQLRGPLRQVSGMVTGRVLSIQNDAITGGVGLRARFYRQLALDLSEAPAVIAPGVSSFVMETSDIPHFLLGEAYYDGGLVLVLVLIAGSLMAGWTTWGCWWLDQRSAAQYGMQFSMWAAFVVVMSLHPGLQTRFVYMMLGLWLAPYVGRLRGSQPPPERST